MFFSDDLTHPSSILPLQPPQSGGVLNRIGLRLINAREVPGHWDGDLITGKDHKPAILVTVARKTRFVQMDLLESMDARTVQKAVDKRFKKLEPALRKSITFDQGKENSGHKPLSENTHYLIRDMLYRVTDFRDLIRRNVSKIARLLNERPRKMLDFRIPQEAFSELR
jgi:IS30 family transposase